MLHWRYTKLKPLICLRLQEPSCMQRASPSISSWLFVALLLRRLKKLEASASGMKIFRSAPLMMTKKNEVKEGFRKIKLNIGGFGHLEDRKPSHPFCQTQRHCRSLRILRKAKQLKMFHADLTKIISHLYTSAMICHLLQWVKDSWYLALSNQHFASVHWVTVQLLTGDGKCYHETGEKNGLSPEHLQTFVQAEQNKTG